MTDPIWWPSIPDPEDTAHKEKVDKWVVELDQMFDPDGQDNVTVHAGTKDGKSTSWVVSHKSIPLHDDDSRVIFDNTEDFV